MRKLFKKVILPIFIILFILASIPLQSLGKNDSIPENLPLSVEYINPDFKTENTISVQFHFEEKDLSLEGTMDGLEIHLRNCKSMNIPDLPALPYFEREIEFSYDSQLTYIKVKEVKTSLIPLPKNIPLKLAPKPKPISLSLPYNSSNELSFQLKRESERSEYLNPYLSETDLRRSGNSGWRYTDSKEGYGNEAYWSSSNSKEMYGGSHGFSEGFRQHLPEIFPDSNFDYVITPYEVGKKLSLFVNPVYYIRGDLVLANYLCLEIGLSKGDLHTLGGEEESKNLSVILTPDEFFNEANKLKSIQESHGYRVSITRLSSLSPFKEAEIPDLKDVKGYKDASNEDKSILKNYNYSLARKIITYLRDLLKGKKINYLTILGDGSKVPPSYYVLSPDNFSDYDKWVPTDIFYFAPDSKSKEYPIEISIGRLPVRDKEEAKNVVDKIDRYRKALSDSWFKNIALMGGDPFGGDYMGELFLADCINKDYLEGLDIKKYFRTSGKFGKEDLLYCLENESVGFINGYGHGGGDTFYLEPGTLNSKEVLSLKKKDELPIFLSVACGNGAYDTLVLDTDFSTNKYLKYPTSFSESLVLGEGGAIAYVGGARINYSGWNMEYENGVPILKRKYFMDAILDYFFKNYHEKVNTLGDIVKLALTTYAEEDMGYISYGDIKTFFGFTLLGDPTIKLPLFSGEFKSKIPEIAPDKEYRQNLWNIPLFPIDDGVQIFASTNSPTLNYIFSDYLNIDSPILEEGKFKKDTSEKFSHNFANLIKSTLTIRIETKDFKEMRIVFFGRYWHDLVVYEDYDLTRLIKGEEKDYVAILKNDGINDEENITVTVKVNEKEIKKLHFGKLPFFQYRYIQYSLPAYDLETKNVEIVAPNLNNEKVTSDNIISKEIIVKEEDVIRVGVLAQSSLLSWSYVSEALNISELNKKLNNSGLPIEIFPITFGRDFSTNTTSLKRLKVDMLILYTNDFFDFTLNQYLSEIEKFIEDGGIVLGILSLEENSFGFSLREIQPLFGLGKEEEFEFVKFDDSKKTLKISDKELFDKDEINITSRYTFASKDKDSWNDVTLEGGELIGISEDGKIGLISYGNRLLYSGYFSWKDLIEEDDTHYLFESLLKVAMRKQVDLSIDKVSLSPIIGRKNNIGELNISVKNCGNTFLEEVNVLVNPLNQTFKVESLKGKEEREIRCEINLRGNSLRRDFEVIIDPEDKISEYNEKNNTFKVCYNVVCEGEPDIEPELTLNIPDYLEVVKPKLIVEGKTNPFASVSLQGEEIAKNSDGSFSKIVDLNKGENYLTFVAREGSLKTEKSIKVILKRSVEILLKIGDKAVFLNDELKILDEPPLILEGVTFVPLRFIGEAFGYKVDWFKEENKIVISNNDNTLIMWIGKDLAKLNDKDLKLPAKPFISKSGRTFVPIRIISEAFGASVSWNAKNSTISIKLKVDYAEENSKTNSLSLLSNGNDEPSPTVLIDASKPSEDVIFPSCFDLYEDELYVSTYRGICVLDKDLNLKKRINYPSFLEDNIDPSYFRALSSTISRNFLRVRGENLIFSDGYDIYIFDKNTGELKTNISGYYYGTLLKPLQKYGYVSDFEIYDDRLFVISSSGINVIDISTGELLSKFIIYDYLIDMALSKEYIYVASLFGGFYRIGLEGEDIKEFEFKEIVNPFSIEIGTDGFLYINSSYPEYTVLKLNANNGEIVKKYKLSGSIGEILDRMIISGDNVFALSFNLRKSSSYLYEEKIVKMDKNFRLLTKLGASGYNTVKSDSRFLINPEYVRITDEGDYLISQYYPLNPEYFKLYSKDGEVKKTFTLTPDSLYWFRIALEVNSNSVGALFADFMSDKYFFKSFEPTSKGTVKTKSVDLKPKAKYNYFSNLSFNDSIILTFEYYSGNVVVFDIESGEELGRFSLCSAENERSLYFPYSMKIVDSRIYIFDFVKEFLRIYSTEGKVLGEMNFNPYSKANKFKYYTDVKIIDESEFALIDSEFSNLLLFDLESLNRVVGEEKKLSFEEEMSIISTDFQSLYTPYSFDLMDESLLINDLGNYRVIERPLSYSKKEKLPLNIKVTPEELNLIAYSKDPLEEEVLVEVFNSDAELKILDTPSWIRIDKFDSFLRNILIKITIDPSKIEVGEKETGVITFGVSDFKGELTINLQREKNEILCYSKSSLIKGKAKNYISKTPIFIDKNIILLGEDILTDVLGFDIKRVGEEVVIFTDKFTVKLKVGERRGSILLKEGVSEIDLGADVLERGEALLIPVNTIFNFLSINYEVNGELVKIFLT